MITEQDLKEAIAECQGQRNPNANTCIKLASYLTIQKELYGDRDIPTYSYAPAPEYDNDSVLLKLLDGKPIEDAIPILDELIETVQLVHPRLYDSFIRKIRQ